MARAAYEYLIQYTSDLKGITQAQGELRKLDAYNKKFGKNVGRVTQVLSRNVTQSTREIKGGAVQTTRNLERTFKTASGGIYTYSNAVTRSGGKVLKSTQKLNKGFGKMQGGMQGLSKGFGMIATRALKTIPVWLLLRTVFTSVTGAISNTIKTWVDLSNEMGRVAGVTRGTQADVDALRDAIIDFSRTSSRGFKEVASVVYALGSAGLTVTEQMAGFKHIMDVTIGTFGNAEQIAKLVAGAYNVFGRSLEDAYTVSSKFQKLSDILSFTYSTQQVELSEIATAMTYVASIGSLMNISFEQLVGTIGVLNTGMLKGSKSGTALMNAFIKLAVSGDRLADLGVIFDPSQPLDFVNVMEQLHNIYGEQALSLQNLKQIMDVFGRRGGRAAAQLVKDYERWKTSLDNTRKSFADFSEEMREKAENTLPGAFKKFGNAFKANFIDKLKESEGPIKRFLNSITEGQERINRLRKLTKLGIVTPYITGIMKTPIYREEDVQLAEELFNKYSDVYKQLLIIRDEEENISKEKGLHITFEEELNDLAKRRSKDLIDDVQLEVELNAILGQILGKTKLTEKERRKLIQWAKEQIIITKEEDKTQAEISKKRKEQIRDIARAGKYQLMAAIGIEESVVRYTKMKDLISDINEKIIINNEQRRKEIEAGKETNLLELERVNIQDILLGKYDTLEQAALHISKVEKSANSIRKFRIGIEEQILAKKREQLNTVTNLVVQYGKADKFERGRIRRALELMGKTPEEVAHAFRTRAFDEKIILDFWSIFDKKQQETITKTATGMYGLNREIANLGDIFEKQFELPKEDVMEYWRLWLDQGKSSANAWSDYFTTLITAKGEVIKGKESELLEQARQMPILTPREVTGGITPVTTPAVFRREIKDYGIIAADTLEKLDSLEETIREKLEELRQEQKITREETVEGLEKVEQAEKRTGEKL